MFSISDWTQCESRYNLLLILKNSLFHNMLSYLVLILHAEQSEARKFGQNKPIKQEIYISIVRTNWFFLNKGFASKIKVFGENKGLKVWPQN